MTKAVQRRRGTNSEHSSFTGLVGELTINTTNYSAHIHDGSTAGGYELARADGSNVSNFAVGGNLNVTGDVTIGGNITLGDADTDSINITADLTSNLIPNANNTYDLGSSSKKWRNLYIDGTANIDSLVATTVDINGTAITATAAELNVLDGITSTTAELNYTDGVTSNIQTQLDAKAPLASPTFTGTVTADGLSLGDNEKAIFGAGSDLQIYHDGSNSYISDQGTGDLIIQGGTNIIFEKTGGEDMLTLANDGSVVVKYNGVDRIQTTSAGIDVTGTATMDGLTVDGTTTLNSTSTSPLKIQRNSGTSSNVSIEFDGATQDFFAGIGSASEDFVVGTNANLNIDNRLRIAASGDISFYDNVGTTPKFFWDASAEFLGIGTTNPQADLVISENGVQGLEITAWEGGDTVRLMGFNRSTSSRVPVTIDASQVIFQANTTTERMRIDSSGNVGIGVVPSAWWSGADTLQLGSGASVFGSSTVHQAILGANYYYNGTNNVYIGTGQSSLYSQLSGTHIWSSAAAGTAGATISFSELMRIDLSGNVGIGNTAPSSYNAVADNLVIGSTGSNGLTIVAGTANDGSIHFADGTSGADAYRGQIYYSHAGNYMVFGTNASERMRIDSSGNLLVGKTSTDNTTNGFVLDANGTLNVVRSSEYLMRLNRTTTDGEILRFQKDGTTVGSIGTKSNDLTVGTGDTGIQFYDFGNSIVPTNLTTNTNIDATIDLGLSGTRFKDLYLSGGVYLGGTGAANKLDDYEEGTWTPALGGTWTTNPTSLSGTYTKVGNVVTIRMIMSGGVKSSAVSGYITGLPFATNNTLGSVGSVSNSFVLDFGNCLFQNTDRIWLTETNFTNTVYISGVYETTA